MVRRTRYTLPCRPACRAARCRHAHAGAAAARDRAGAPTALAAGLRWSADDAGGRPYRAAHLLAQRSCDSLSWSAPLHAVLPRAVLPRAVRLRTVVARAVQLHDIDRILRRCQPAFHDHRRGDGIQRGRITALPAAFGAVAGKTLRSLDRTAAFV